MGWFRKGNGTSIVPAASRDIAQQGRNWWEGKKEVAGLSRATESIASKRELTREIRGLWDDLTDLNKAIEDHGASEARLKDAPVRYEAEKRGRHIGYLKTDMEYMDMRMKHADKQVEYEKKIQGSEEEIRRFRPTYTSPTNDQQTTTNEPRVTVLIRTRSI